MPLSKQLQIGKAAEHLVCAKLIMKGYHAFLSDQGSMFDVVVQTKKGLKTIQVKSTKGLTTAGKSFDVYRFSTRRGTKFNRVILSDGIDYFAFVEFRGGNIAFIPTRDMISKNKKIKTLIEFRDKNKKYKGRVYSNGTIRKRFGKFIQDYPFRV